MKVRLLLDVDGVLNAVPNGSGTPAWDNYASGKAHGFPITFSPTVARFIAALPDDGVEVMWLTTWEDLANLHIGPLLGLPWFKVAGRPPPEETVWWKLVLAQRLWDEEHIPFVWIDDDLRFDTEAQEWLALLDEQDCLAISPDSRMGIAPVHLDMIAAFVGRIAKL